MTGWAIFYYVMIANGALAFVLAAISLRRTRREVRKHEQREAYARQRAAMMNRYGRTASKV